MVGTLHKRRQLEARQEPGEGEGLQGRTGRTVANVGWLVMDSGGTLQPAIVSQYYRWALP